MSQDKVRVAFIERIRGARDLMVFGSGLGGPVEVNKQLGAITAYADAAEIVGVLTMEEAVGILFEPVDGLPRSMEPEMRHQLRSQKPQESEPRRSR